MIDKQIIDEMIERIGFDVQQCGYLKIIKDALNYPEIGGTFTAFECNLYSRDCDFIERCRYKQLLRKEQECEELKKELETVYDDCKGCPTCNEALYNANLYSKECRKLKQTLTDIKEICNSVENIENINSLYDAKLSGMFLQANKILQKISECEVKNE